MIEIDARDLLCPLPVLRLSKTLQTVLPGTQVTLLATDKMARIDVPHFCTESGHKLISMTPVDSKTTRYLVICESKSARL